VEYGDRIRIADRTIGQSTWRQELILAFDWEEMLGRAVPPASPPRPDRPLRQACGIATSTMSVRAWTASKVRASLRR
jgi:hypothetical protein